MLKNTNKEYSILQRNEKLNHKLIGNVVVFTLAGVLIGNVMSKKDNKQNHEILTQVSTAASVSESNTRNENFHGHDGYNYYWKMYFEARDKLSKEDFDLNFNEICKNGIYKINGKEYSVGEIYIVKCEDDSLHLIKAGENKLDILTNLEFDSKKIITLQFSNSKVFYDMYKDGVFNSVNIQVTNDVFNRYAINWNGEKHLQTVEQKAEEYAHEEYQKKYGG